MTVAVIGGAGYIGAHLVQRLWQQHEVVVVDDCSTGHAGRTGSLPALTQDVAASGAVDELARFFRNHHVHAILHFAAKKQVAESVRRPLWYYRQNVQGTANVLDACVRAGVTEFVFSSSAAVYGSPAVSRVDETTVPEPINPYGQTKLAGEWLVADVARTYGLRTTSLRYFNVVGAASGPLADTGTFNLVPIIFDRVSQGRAVDVYGADYPTPDGTCIRDYVHVQDLADAHVAALHGLTDLPAGASRLYNVGTGVGTSVFEIIDLVESITGTHVERQIAQRRPGDPPTLSADASLIDHDLGWRSRLSVADAVRSTWAHARSR